MLQEEEREGDVDYAVDPKALQEAKGTSNTIEIDTCNIYTKHAGRAGLND